MSLSDISIADARITDLTANDGRLCLNCLDWQERPFTLIFSNVIAFEVLDTFNIDLSHATESKDDPYIRQVVERGEHEGETFTCYTVWSAWDEHHILRAVAEDVLSCNNC